MVTQQSSFGFLVQLFEKLDAGKTEYTVRASFLEIYNEDIFDLLSSDVGANPQASTAVMNDRCEKQL